MSIRTVSKGSELAANSLKALQSSAPEKLDRYTSPKLRYAFHTYDRRGEWEAPLTPADVLMANLLSLQLSARDVIPLFMDDEGPAQRLLHALNAALAELGNAEAFETYDELSELEGAVQTLAAANVAAIPVKWWTAVTVSKVLHRRRPHIVPLIDSRIRKFYGAKPPALVRQALWEDIRENADWMGDLAATKRTPDGHPLSLLRLADILIWTPDRS